MAITQWCWRCQKDVPMLDETEWQSVGPLLGSSARLTGDHDQQKHGKNQCCPH